VKVVEIDLQRKRIALSIKQTEPAQAPQQRRENRNASKPQQGNSKPQPKDLGNLNMQDALAALKNKFGK
jgi:uncharacterized protein